VVVNVPGLFGVAPTRNQEVIAAGAGSIWVITRDGIDRLNATSGRIVAKIPRSYPVFLRDSQETAVIVHL
jgi:hypothetical protein